MNAFCNNVTGYFNQLFLCNKRFLQQLKTYSRKKPKKVLFFFATVKIVIKFATPIIEGRSLKIKN